MNETIIGSLWLIGIISIIIVSCVFDYLSTLKGLDEKRYELSKRKKRDKKAEKEEKK